MSVTRLRPDSFDPATEPTALHIRADRRMLSVPGYSNRFADAVRAYERDVQDAAADLVERGDCSPWEAMQRASQIVRDQRANRRNITPLTVR